MINPPTLIPTVRPIMSLHITFTGQTRAAAFPFRAANEKRRSLRPGPTVAPISGRPQT